MRTLVALRRLAEFIIGARLPTSTLHCDNMSVVLMLQRRDLKPTMRHVAVGLGFIYDTIDSGEVVVRHIRTAVNPANTFTAAESRDRFAQSVSILCGQKHVWTPSSAKATAPEESSHTPAKGTATPDDPSPCSVVETGRSAGQATGDPPEHDGPNKENTDPRNLDEQPDVPVRRVSFAIDDDDDASAAVAVADARRRCLVGDIHL